MAGKFSSFNILPLGSGLDRNNMDELLHARNSNSGHDHAEESDSLNSHVLGSNSTAGSHQNNIIARGGHEWPFGQLGLSQRANATRKTCVTPTTRVEVQSSVEYFLDWENMPASNNPKEVIVTEVVRTTKFLTSTPAMENLFTAIKNFQKQSPPASYEPNRNISHEENSNAETEGDGRTHSLPHKKYGPYTCPKCNHAFSTSQSFAAHTLTHYKHESSEERKKRLAAKYKSKNLHLVYQNGGLTMLPMSSRMPYKRNYTNKRSYEEVDANVNHLKNNVRRKQGKVRTSAVVKEEIM